MNDIQINLTLPLQQLDIVAAGLGKLPYEAVQPIIDEIRRQAMPQIELARQQEKAPDGDNA